MTHLYTLRRILSALFLLMLTTMSWAYDFSIDGIYYNFDKDHISVSVTYNNYGRYYSGDIVIPSSVSYEDKTYIVTSIGYYAFNGCSSLTSISIPEGVTSIADHAFQACSSLTSITVAANNPVYDSREGCNAIIKTLSNTLITGCQNTIIPESVTSIGSSAFDGCSSLTSISIPDGVTSIEGYAFRDCSSLTSISIPKGVTSIGDRTFYDCSSLTSISIPEGMTSIGECAFYGCRSLTSIEIPNSVTSIGDYAFSNCESLYSVTIGSGVLSIGRNAFSTPKKVIWLTNTPPSGYTNAKGTVNYVANEQYTSLENKTVYPFLSSMFEVGGVKYVPVSPSERTCDVIDCAYNESAENININNSVENMGISLTVQNMNPYAFYGCTGLKNIQLNNHGTIGANAYQNCLDLETVTLGERITSLGSFVFSGCSMLQNIVVPDSIQSLGSYAFSGCESLKSAKIGEGIREIERYTFSGCSALIDIRIGSNVGTIDNYAFNNCSSLTEIVIPQSVTKINDYVFKGCSSLANVTLEDVIKEELEDEVISTKFPDWISTNHNHSSTSSKEYTFSVVPGDYLSFNYSVDSESGYDKLIVKINGNTVLEGSGKKTGSYRYEFTENEEVTLYLSYTKDDSNSSGADQASVTEIWLNGSSVTDDILTIGSNGSSPLFVDCPLNTIYIGRNISYSTSSSYGYSPFYRNTSLTTVTITDEETEIPANEFYGCTNLKNVTIGNNVTTIGDWAFSGCSSLDKFEFGFSVDSIGKEAFSDCTAMTKLVSHAIIPPMCGANALDDINKWACTLSVPQGYTATYQQAEQWKDFFFINDDVEIDTGIENTIAVDTDDVTVYTLNGIKQTMKKNKLKSLPKGIYIINGKKILIK